MNRILEAILSVAKAYTDEEPKQPMHVGEVMSVWTTLTIFEEARNGYLIGTNTTTDPELRRMLASALEQVTLDIRILRDFLMREGIPLPPTSEPKPESNPQSVPHGVKLTDHEIANAISAKIATCISLCGASLAQAVRVDVALLFLRIQIQLLKYGGPLRETMKNRGWLVIPPYYYPPGGTPDPPHTP